MARTKESAADNIKKGLVRLLKAKEYTDITMTDLANEAGVARVTLYRLYGSVENVLEAMVDDLWHYAQNELIPFFVGNHYDRWLMALTKLYEDLKTTKPEFSVLRAVNSATIFNRVERRIIKLFDHQNQDIADKYTTVAQLSMVAGIAMQWMVTGYVESPQDMAEFTLSLLKKF